MLSKDISTEFRGRSSQIHVFPLSFSEYYNYIGGDINEALNNSFDEHTLFCCNLMCVRHFLIDIHTLFLHNIMCEC